MAVRIAYGCRGYVTNLDYSCGATRWQLADTVEPISPVSQAAGRVISRLIALPRKEDNEGYWRAVLILLPHSRPDPKQTAPYTNPDAVYGPLLTHCSW